MKVFQIFASLMIAGALGLGSVAAADKAASDSKVTTTNSQHEVKKTHKAECKKDGKHMAAKNEADCRARDGTWTSEDSTQVTDQPTNK